MTVITKIELIETWLLIWTGSHHHKSRLLGLLLLLMRFGSIIIYAAITLLVVGIDAPAADRFAISAALTFCGLLLVLMVVSSTAVTRTLETSEHSTPFLRRLSVSIAFALPVLVAMHYGLYAFPLIILPLVTLTSEVLLKAQLSHEYLLVALIGCAMPIGAAV